MRKLTELEQSHACLLAALTLAGIHIRALRKGQDHNPELALLRSVVRKARAVAEQYDPDLMSMDPRRTRSALRRNGSGLDSEVMGGQA